MSKKELSNLTAPSPRRFTLPKSHILRGRRNFSRLFTSSKFINTPTISFRYATYSSIDEGFKMGFISPKKIGNAVKRNRSRRLLREAYRLNKHILSDILSDSKGGLHAVFLARQADLDFQSVEIDMITILKELRSQILSLYSDEL